MRTMKDYHDLYLKFDDLYLNCDILHLKSLLLDVPEKFRSNSLKNYGLWLSHYLSAPALNWDVILKTTKVELQFIPDLHMYIFFEKVTRGGVSYISNRYSKANNNYLKPYDLKQESRHIIYLGANNLYS